MHKVKCIQCYKTVSRILTWPQIKLGLVKAGVAFVMMPVATMTFAAAGNMQTDEYRVSSMT